jgi:heat-inducible transcriptional repressor
LASSIWRNSRQEFSKAGKMPDLRLSPRERLVLTTIIELYIATGEPVASQGVARFFAHKEGLSSATLRNVMASLGEAGLLEQPHTSAGRVPTAARLPSPARSLPDSVPCRKAHRP